MQQNVKGIKMPDVILHISKSFCSNIRSFLHTHTHMHTHTHTQPIEILKGSQRLKFERELEFIILNPSTPWISLLILSSNCYTFPFKQL